MKNIKADLSIKFISLVTAFLIWAIIRNVMNPLVNGFVNVPIKVVNESYLTEQNKAYTILDTKVARITYKVESDYQTNIRQSDFDVYIDLSELEYTNQLEVKCNVLNGVDSHISNVQVEPKTLHVEIDNALRNEYTIKYDIKGNVDPGHSVGNVILSPSILYVSGSSIAVNDIDHIAIEIPMKPNEENFSGIASPIIYAKDGKVIPSSGLALSTDTINYTVVMFSRANVTLNAVVEGNVSTGYTYAGVQVYPNTIMIDGPKSVIQNIYTLDLPTINIDGLTGNKEFTFNTSDFIPLGIRTNTNTVTANVTINDNVINRPSADTENIGPHNEEMIETETSSGEETTEQTTE